ncbi:hypothetical protein PMAYCL1PPCAC_17775 [Pristionchus mayeri]|uniref:Uncharacterized protein n=1 Tax=Pristionchus mayeri TaxID=1317129 RepID=A0AAN5I0X3_9BILA|nr:hypothetical protein PMAYCL1PPCAC_17775 [Pristionchus mayeri]
MSDSEDQRFRNDVSYRSLRKSSRMVFGSIRKKLSTVEESMRQRKALAPLENESDQSVPPTPEKKEKTDDSMKEQRTMRRARHAEILEEVYEFDDVSNLMKTPLLRKTPEPRFFSGVSRFSRLRESMSVLPSLKQNKKDSPPPAISPSARLAKRLATCKIHKMHSPKQNILKKKLSQLRLRKAKNCEISEELVEETLDES